MTSAASDRTTGTSTVVARFYVGSGVNALGSGMYLTAGVIYLVKATRLDVTTLGMWMTASALLGTAASLWIGVLADRVGPVSVMRGTYVVQAVGMVLLTRSTSTVIAIGLVLFFLGQRSTNSLSAAASATLGDARTRVGIRATTRAVNNGGIAVGSVAAGVILGVADDGLLRLVPVLNAVSFVVAAALLPVRTQLPNQRTGGSISDVAESAHRTTMRCMPSPAPSRRFILLAAANGLLTLHFDVQTILLPLWILDHAPSLAPWAVGYAFALNTLLVVTASRWHAMHMDRRGTRRTAAAGSGALIAGAFGCYATLPCVAHSPTAIAVLTVGVVLQSVGEIAQANAFGAAALDLADPALQGVHQSVFYLVGGVVRAAAPVTLTWLLVWSTAATWVSLGMGVLLAGACGSRLVPEVSATPALVLGQKRVPKREM